MLNKSSYMVLNYNTSPVSIKTRFSSELIPAGNDDNPSSVPLSLDDIVYANNAGNAFKIGLLRFDPEYEDELYQELRISNWQDILTNSEIYEIIQNPDVAGLERLIAIQDPMYFDRVYGAFIGLRNEGATISTKVDDIMRVRRKELKERKRKSEIKLTAVTHDSAEDPAAQIDAMRKQIEEMQKFINSVMKTAGEDSSESDAAAEKPATKAKGTRSKKVATATKTEEALAESDEATAETN